MSKIPHDLTLNRDSRFSYTCNRCAHCCYDRRIQLNPYEVARLAQNQGITSGKLIQDYLEPGKPYLRRREEGCCVFLTPEGCGVYPDRPLVCRLYPLGQRVKGSGSEQFIAMTPHPETEGTYGQVGTVADFLNAQEVEPFMAARNRYLKIVHQALHGLASLTSEDQEIYETAIQTFENQGHIARTLSSWLDVDHVVFRYCLEKGLPEPQGLEERVELHLASLKSWIDHLIQGNEHEGHPAIT